MTKPSPSHTTPTPRDSARAADAPGDTVTASGRRPYRRPEVHKRRSLSQATLVSGTGTPSTVVGGMT